MLYDSVNGSKLLHKCKNCSYECEVDYATSAVCVVSNSVAGEKASYNRYMSKYIKFDPTLPRVKNIVCVNEKCTKKSDQDNEIIYIKYDYKNLKYLYFCCHCDEFWTTSNKA